MIKQVEEMPKTGEFSSVWEYEGCACAGGFFYLSDGMLAWGAGYGVYIGDEVCDKVIQAIKNTGKFFVSVSEFEKITFDYEWELFKYLRENEGAKLYSEPKYGAESIAYFEDGIQKVNKRGWNSLLCVDIQAVYQKYWYVKKV